jgi:uncharacterized membrane protein YhaH (DUF805 family)
MDWKWLLTSFDGRINRAKFWAGIGALLALGIVATLIDILIGSSSFDIGGGNHVGIVSLLASLVSIYLALALYAKRWHDRDKSGWWSLIALVPFIGAIWILVELGMLEGTRGANQYGPDPLA